MSEGGPSIYTWKGKVTPLGSMPSVKTQAKWRSQGGGRNLGFWHGLVRWNELEWVGHTLKVRWEARKGAPRERGAHNSIKSSYNFSHERGAQIP
jgi:hypothetical protein